MNIFLTGASGFLGKSVLKKLISENHTVLALSRTPESDKLILSSGGIAVRGDLYKIKEFEVLLKDIDVVVHCAAPVEFWGPWEKFENGIVVSTSQLAEACAKKGVRRFIHVSSESVLQDKDSLLDIDETHPYPKEPNSFYGKAKKLAEQFLLSSTFPMEVIVIRPTFIWGPGANALKTIGDKVRSGEFMWIDHGRASFEAVHVENVAEIIHLALTKGKDRSIYFVTDEAPSNVKDFFTSIFQDLGLPRTNKSMPGWVASFAANIIESIWNILRLKSIPPLTRFDLAFVKMPRRYNITKSKVDLGYKPVVTREKGFKSLSR